MISIPKCHNLVGIFHPQEGDTSWPGIISDLRTQILIRVARTYPLYEKRLIRVFFGDFGDLGLRTFDCSLGLMNDNVI